MSGAESTVTYSKMILPIPAKDAPPKNVLISKADTLLRGLKSCDAFEAKGKKEGAMGQERVGPIKMTTLVQSVQTLLMNVSAGEISLPSDDPQGIVVYMMCSREDKPAPLPTRESVRRQIEGERIEMLAGRHMRDLRRSAFIDTRL
jgi:peptidyl-prolyl cis-trans isomerase SurA